MHAFEKMTFTGLRDDPSHDNFEVFNEQNMSYRGMGENYFEMEKQKNLSKQLVNEFDKSGNKDNAKIKELKDKLMKSAYKTLLYNDMKKEYAAKYKASGNNQDSSYKLGTEMVDNLENFEKKGTARTIEKVVNSVPEFKKNFEERIINRMTSKNHHRFSEFSINDCCLNAIADTIMSTKKPNICNEIIKELGVSVKDVNDIITAKAEMNKRNDTNLHARHV